MNLVKALETVLELAESNILEDDQCGNDEILLNAQKDQQDSHNIVTQLLHALKYDIEV